MLSDTIGIMKTTRKSEQSERFSSYDLFIALLSVLSIINIVLYYVFKSPTIEYVISTMDLVLSAIFFIDFLKRLYAAKSKSTYFFKELGWADLLASMPFPQFKILRIFRLIKAYSIISIIGPKNVAKEITKNRASSALYLIMFLIIILLEFASIAILYVEQDNTAANITSASDAIWWVYVTITTVGYGDQYPVTNVGRFIGMLVMFVGVGLFGVLTGFLANTFLPQDSDSKNYDADINSIRNDIKEIKELLTNKT